MHTITLYLRSVASKHDDVPAFRAARAVAIFLAAALLPGSVIALCVLARVVCDSVVCRDAQERSWPETFRALWKRNGGDAVLLALSLGIGLLIGKQSGVFGPAGARGIVAALVVGAGILVPRMLILSHTAAVFLTPPAPRKGTARARLKRLPAAKKRRQHSAHRSRSAA